MTYRNSAGMIVGAIVGAIVATIVAIALGRDDGAILAAGYAVTLARGRRP
jgi:hypothetical protein